MAIQFVTANSSGNDPLSQQTFNLIGDGTSSSITIDLTASPVGLLFAGNNAPSAVVVANFSPSTISPVGASVSKARVTITFGSAFSSTAQVVLQFYYSGA